MDLIDIQIIPEPEKIGSENNILPPIPRRSEKIASENELPELIESKNNEKVIFKPEIYDETKKRSRPMSVPLSGRTIKNLDRISKTKENIMHSNLVEKELEGLDPIEAFKQKLLFKQLNIERKKNPKLSKSSQIEIKKGYLDKKYRDKIPFKDDDDDDDNLYIINEEPKGKQKNKKINKSESLVYDPDASYMQIYNNSVIETDNLKRYVNKKKYEEKKLNIREINMFGSDIELIRKQNDRKSVSYDTNYNVAGPEYVGADDQLYEFCHERNYISLPEKYVEFHKKLENCPEDEDIKEIKVYNTPKTITPIENEKKNEINEIKEEKKDNIKNSKDSKFKESRGIKKKLLDKCYNIDDKTLDIDYEKNSLSELSSRSRMSRRTTPIKTYYGSYSGYNALSRPALNASLIQRHNAHRNKERYNIEQVVLRRLRYILGYNAVDRDHLNLVDSLNEEGIPDNIVQYIFQQNFESLDELRRELLCQVLDDNKNIENDDDEENIKETKNKKQNEKINKQNNKNENENENENKNINKNRKGKEKNRKELNKTIENRTFSTSSSKIDIKNKDINLPKPKSLSKKMRIFPKTKEACTPDELLYIIDNYKKMNKKIKNDYKRYNLDNKNTKNSNEINESFIKSNNRTLSYNEILKALQE